MYGLIWLVAADIHMIRISCRSVLGLDILWDIDQYRSRLAGTCDLECHLDDLAQILAVTHGHTIFYNASRHTNDINFLKGIVSDQVLRHLTGKDDKRNTVVMCICDPGNRIGCPRSTGHQTYTDASCCSSVSFCLMDQRLLMARQNNMD